MLLKNIDFETKNSHFLDLCSKLRKMMDFGLTYNQYIGQITTKANHLNPKTYINKDVRNWVRNENKWERLSTAT